MKKKPTKRKPAASTHRPAGQWTRRLLDDLRDRLAADGVSLREFIATIYPDDPSAYETIRRLMPKDATGNLSYEFGRSLEARLRHILTIPEDVFARIPAATAADGKPKRPRARRKP